MAFMAASLLASCSDGKDKDYSGDFGQIRVPDTRQLEQTVTADETQAAQGVTFTTEGAWTSAITQTRAEAPDWISVSPNHGDAAGSYTLKITLDSNGSEETRAAKIVVTCGTSKIEINVTQEGTDNPITPTLNSRISKIEYYRDFDKPTIISRQIANLHFEYDGQGRITSYKYEDMESPSDGIEQAITLTYPDSKTLKIKSTEDDEDEAFTVTLNNAGYATEIRRDGGSEHWTVSYDSNNRCTECRQTGTDQSTDCPRSAFDWSNGNLVAFNSFKANGDKAPEYSHTIAYDAIVELTGPDGIRRQPIREFYIRAGKVDIRPGEIQTAILIEKDSYIDTFGHYIKYAMRNAMDIATLGTSVNVRLSADKKTVERARVAFGVAGPVPLRAAAAEELAAGQPVSLELADRFAQAVKEDINPRDSWRAAKDFRMHIAVESARRAFIEAVKLAGGDL